MAQENVPKTRVVLAHGATPITEGGVVNIGTHTVEMPDVEGQKAGFELPTPDAKRVINQWPDRYKRMETDGVSRQAQQGQNQQQTESQQGQQEQIRDDDASDDDASGDNDGGQRTSAADEEVTQDAEAD